MMYLRLRDGEAHDPRLLPATTGMRPPQPPRMRPVDPDKVRAENEKRWAGGGIVEMEKELELYKRKGVAAHHVEHLELAIATRRLSLIGSSYEKENTAP